MEQWLNNIESDTSHRSAHAKVAVDKPASLVDGCFVAASTAPVPQPGGLSFTGTSGPCPAVYPVFASAGCWSAVGSGVSEVRAGTGELCQLSGDVHG
jgi:hypothetical protein